MPLLTTAHDSGFRRLAKPYLTKGFHLQSSADLARRTGCPLTLWLGGMFFAHQVLRPVVIDLLDPPIRLQLWLGVFRRFFPWVWLAVSVLLGSGLWIIEFYLGGMFGAPMHVHYMFGAGLIMIGIFAYVYIVPYRALSNAVAEKNWPAGGAALAKIRRLVGINTIIGILVVVIATAGKYYGMPALFSL